MQGRSIHRENTATSRKADAEAGREYARLTHALGMDPRSFVLKQTAEFLPQVGFPHVKAIKPAHHVMNLAGHPNFVGKYEPTLISAGFTEDQDVYLAVPENPKH